ncbi:MAG: exodeoxyribonuclease VII large subunit [Patescibacteria group bacterium]|nr:exodeoxyribonuclease VII large subunit [Patescibacteria group bacterium]
MIDKEVKTNLISTKDAVSVSDYINFLNRELKQYPAKIIGEVGVVKISTAGHVYFTLKDQNEEYTINCIIWRGNYSLFSIELKEGMELIVTGQPKIYEVRGDLSFIAETIELVGEGKLRKEYEKLKKKLTMEGIFDPSRKRPIPQYPQKIGVITSRKGAVIEDFLNNLNKFGFQVKMIDTAVEGQRAVKPLLAAIKIFSKQDIDVLVIIRGGGSMESLVAFDNEILVREVANFPVPVIAGIGHHKDVPLVALAADRMESTPTAATKVINKSWEEAYAKLDRYEYQIMDYFNRLISNARIGIDRKVSLINDELNKIFNKFNTIKTNLKLSISKMEYSLSSIRSTLVDYPKSVEENFFNLLSGSKTNLDNFWSNTKNKFQIILANYNRNLAFSDKIIRSNDPLKNLKLGYSIAKINGRVIRTIEDIKINDEFDLQITDGIINSTVRKINKLK